MLKEKCADDYQQMKQSYNAPWNADSPASFNGIPYTTIDNGSLTQ
jgi:hypothetical protein